MNRRTFLGLGVGLTVGGSIGLADATADTYALATTNLTLPVADLPSAFEDYRIAFISDAHVGVCSNLDFISSTARAVADSSPDMILHGGDYLWRLDSSVSKWALSASQGKSCMASVEASAGDWYSQFADIFSATPPAPDGSFGVVGNHDGGIGKQLCRQILGTRGIKILINEQVTITRGTQRLRLIGYDDYWTGIPQTPALPKMERRREVRVVLSHNPDLFSGLLADEQLDFDVGLAGHTHGGQIKIPGIGALFYNVRDDRFREGLWRGTAPGQRERAVYTSRGLGTVVFPVRIGCPPELTLLTLKRA